VIAGAAGAGPGRVLADVTRLRLAELLAERLGRLSQGGQAQLAEQRALVGPDAPDAHV
jgi:hypothetical protein